MAMNIKSVVFWDMALWSLLDGYITEKPVTSIFSVEDEGGKFLKNVGNHLPDYTAAQPRRPQS
jgi:hypothetical protein